MGLFSLATAAAGFITIGTWESMASSDETPPPASISPPTIDQLRNLTPQDNREHQSSSSLIYIAVGLFSVLFIVDSLISIFNAVSSQDPVGVVLPLQVLGIAALFCLYSILGLAPNFFSTVRFPPSILDLILLFAFAEEFLLYYQQRKDTSGIENRYFDLMLVPLSICVISTILELKTSFKLHNYARMARGVGLILQGTWFLQMGISFYSNMIVSGCSLHQKSRSNYTIRCKGHEDYHRARGIATLQFNCHLAFLVILAVSMYSIMIKKNGDPNQFLQYKPLGTVMMEQMGNNGHFTLDSDEDEAIGEEENVSKKKLSTIELSFNGYVSHE
ncbi:uncharacterized protein [Euphorbia lathyris]|uniref:uncharacterized protein n=1 Tax=Euphorbia lathyris TaxID=212925 RepID=UPI00331341EC